MLVGGERKDECHKNLFVEKLVFDNFDNNDDDDAENDYKDNHHNVKGVGRWRAEGKVRTRTFLSRNLFSHKSIFVNLLAPEGALKTSPCAITSPHQVTLRFRS